MDRVFADDSTVVYCFMHDGSRSREQFIRKHYDIEPLTLRTGQHLIVMRAHSACLCGAQNCPVSAYVQHKEIFRNALSSIAIESHFSKSGTAVITSHDSALTSFRNTYVFDSTRYVNTKSEFVNNETGEVKPSEVRVRFAAGATSSEVSGHVELGFPDTYIVTAMKGQVLHVKLDTRFADVMVTRGESGQPLAMPSDAWSGQLPASGDYRIIVDGKSENAAHYHLSISIK